MPVRITISKQIIWQHLFNELIAAGYNNLSWPSDLSWFQVENSIDTAGVTAVYTAHTGLPYASENRFSASRAIAKAIPNWSTWSQADWATYYNANISPTQINSITNIATAIVVLRAMGLVLNALAQMAIAMRDYIWADLQDR